MRENSLNQRSNNLDKREENLDRKEQSVDDRKAALEEKHAKLDATIIAQEQRLQEIAQLNTDEAKKIIMENKEDVILIAETLLEHEQITAEEIDYLLEHRHLKRDEAPLNQPNEEKGDK